MKKRNEDLRLECVNWDEEQPATLKSKGDGRRHRRRRLLGLRPGHRRERLLTLRQGPPDALPRVT